MEEVEKSCEILAPGLRAGNFRSCANEAAKEEATKSKASEILFMFENLRKHKLRGRRL
jgi:hypothetical protein